MGSAAPRWALNPTQRWGARQASPPPPRRGVQIRARPRPGRSAGRSGTHRGVACGQRGRGPVAATVAAPRPLPPPAGAPGARGGWRRGRRLRVRGLRRWLAQGAGGPNLLLAGLRPRTGRARRCLLGHGGTGGRRVPGLGSGLQPRDRGLAVRRQWASPLVWASRSLGGGRLSGVSAWFRPPRPSLSQRR